MYTQMSPSGSQCYVPLNGRHRRRNRRIGTATSTGNCRIVAAAAGVDGDAVDAAAVGPARRAAADGGDDDDDRDAAADTDAPNATHCCDADMTDWEAGAGGLRRPLRWECARSRAA